MAKRKADSGNEKPSDESKMDVDGQDDDSGSDDDASIIDIDFTFHGLNSTIDFHGIKTLLRQLLDVDNELFELSALSDLLLSQQPSIGTTVKTDGEDSDPFAFMTVLNLSHHKDKPIVQDLTKYLIDQAPKAGLSQLPSLLSPSSPSQIALIISERVINMPHAIVPPLYTFLHTEITAAAATSPAHAFTHYLLLSKTYTEVASQLDVEPAQGSSKKAKKAAAAAANPEVFYFHPEDEALHRHALAFGNYDYVKQGDEGASDAKRAFQEMGVRPQGHLILIEAGKFEAATKAVAEYLGGAE